jgi:hypothetical protein
MRISVVAHALLYVVSTEGMAFLYNHHIDGNQLVKNTKTALLIVPLPLLLLHTGHTQQ